jgi:O-antigen ligase
VTGLAQSRAMSLPRAAPAGPLLRDGLLAAFLVALAVSISASQILLAVLFVVAVPWPALGRALGAGGPRAGLAALWNETAWIRRQPLTAPFAVLATLTLLSALLSGDAGYSLSIAIRHTLRIATFYLVLHYTRDTAHAGRVWLAFVAVLTLMAAYGLAQAYLCRFRPAALPEAWLGEICVHASRVSGPFSIYMTFAGVLLLGALFLLAHLATVRWRTVWWMVPAAALTVAALAFTYSRNAWLGLAAGAVMLIVTGRRAGRVVTILALIALVTMLFAPDTVRQRARSLLDPRDATMRDRVAMWRSGAAMVADRPLLGVGPGEVRAWYLHYRRPEAVRPSTGHLHNSAVQLAAERGLPALLAWCWLWVVFFRRGGRVLARLAATAGRPRALVLASLVGVLAFLVAGLFEDNFRDAEVVMLVYALMTLPFVVERDLDAGSPALR